MSSSASPAKVEVVGGVPLRLWGAVEARAPFVVFASHGRLGQASDLDRICLAIASRCNQLAQTPHVLVVAVDHRNHGHRLVSKEMNEGWSQNPTHIVDMYSIQWGTACDVRSLADMLPAKLNIEPVGFGMVGVSLGGHATLLTLANDERFVLGVSIIGCGDYATLMEHRARAHKTDTASDDFLQKRFPPQLRRLIERVDPIHRCEAFGTIALLVIGGEDDHLVPPACNQRFLSRVKEEQLKHPARGGELVEIIVPKAGHEVSRPMVEAMTDWFATHITQYRSSL